MLFNLIFLNNTISPCFVSFFFIIDFHFTILTLIAQIFNPAALIPIGIPTKEARAEIEAHPVTGETKKINK